jgi:hypothetical protein
MKSIRGRLFSFSTDAERKPLRDLLVRPTTNRTSRSSARPRRKAAPRLSLDADRRSGSHFALADGFEPGPRDPRPFADRISINARRRWALSAFHERARTMAGKLHLSYPPTIAKVTVQRKRLNVFGQGLWHVPFLFLYFFALRACVETSGNPYAEALAHHQAKGYDPAAFAADAAASKQKPPKVTDDWGAAGSAEDDGWGDLEADDEDISATTAAAATEAATKRATISSTNDASDKALRNPTKNPTKTAARSRTRRLPLCPRLGSPSFGRWRGSAPWPPRTC